MVSKIWPTDLPKEALEEMILAAANNYDQIVELSDGRRFKVTARVIEAERSAKDFLIKGGTIGVRRRIRQLILRNAFIEFYYP